MGITAEELVKGFKLASFPGIRGTPLREAAFLLHEACDLHCHGYVDVESASFLDRYEPTPWLTAEPDHDAKDNFLAVLRARYPNLVKAFRQLFDHKNINRVNYKGFHEGCQ